MSNSKRLPAVALLAACLALPPIAMATTASTEARSDSILLGSFGRVQGWKAVSRNQLVLSVSPSKSYLVTLQAPYSGLRFAQAIGLTTSVGRVTKFDSVVVDGRRLPIATISKIDRETAKSLRWRSRNEG